MNKFLKNLLNYKEYLYYYKIVLVVLLSTLIEGKIEYNFLGYLIRSVMEFVGIKYWVFKNNWNNKKGLKQEILLYVFVKLCLFIIRPLILNIGEIYNKLSIQKQIKKLSLIKIHNVLNFLKTGGIDRNTFAGSTLWIIYEFLTTSLVLYPFYRYIIFTPN
jgi:hypothetical protein